jgi:hypothetical protein
MVSTSASDKLKMADCEYAAPHSIIVDVELNEREIAQRKKQGSLPCIALGDDL